MLKKGFIYYIKKFKTAEVYQNNRQRSWASYQLSHHNQWAFPPIQFDV